MQHHRSTVAIDAGRGHKGTVISFDPIGGYGFIKPDIGGQNVCILAADVESAMLRAVHPGQTLEYELSCNRAGTAIAVNLRAERD